MQFPMVDKPHDALGRQILNTCSLEDLDLTYLKLKKIGHEEVQRRLDALKELQKSVEIAKLRMTKEAKPSSMEHASKLFGCKTDAGRQELLTLPKIHPEVFPFDSFKGSRGIYQRDKLNEELRPKKRSKKTKSSQCRLCVNCQLEAISQEPWLPQLDESKFVGRVTKKDSKEEKFVLPDIRIGKILGIISRKKSNS